MTRLYIVDKYPSEYASGVYINSPVWGQFSVPIDSSTATYYNFSLTEKVSYEAVEGVVSVESISGVPNALVKFTPSSNLKCNTEYSMLVSTGIKAKDTEDYLLDDTVWYFTTGNSEFLGDDVLNPSGVTTDTTDEDTDGSGIYSSEPLTVLETAPVEYSYNVGLNIPFIGIKFSDLIPEGINLNSHIKLTARKILS